MRRAAALLGLLVAAHAAAAAAAEPLTVAVIVHPTRSDRIESLAQLRGIYLRQRRFWDDRSPILPVNREYDSAPRRIFERAVFAGFAESLARYWNEQYFQGQLPPATLASDAAVRQFVATKRNAVGYIDARHVDDSVRVLLRIGPRDG